ncbi:MAG: tetratricopeptide repeat protein, partial [Gemmataceae bacterium]
MASSSADPSISSPPPGTVVREAATRDHLWQVPVFFAGLVTLFWVWNCRPFCLDSTARRIERQLSEARDLLTRPEGDAENALRLALAALESSDSLPDRAGEAAFLAGWAYIRQAERADPIESRQAWQQAQEYLNQAQRNQVSDTDEPLMKYRQAKVAFHLGEPLPRVIEMLEDAVPKADLQAEGYSLLAQAYLKLPQPDLGQALTANQKLRDVTEATEAELIQARLQGGEILLRMGKMEEARKTLEKIPDQAPAGIVARSRRIRARTFQEEKQWGEAIRLYQAALADSRVPPADQSTIYFNLGLCYRNLEQPQEAARAWQECLKPGGGPESQAAAFYLGELRLHEQAYEQAVHLLSESVANVGKPLVWKNPIVSLQNARDLFEKALKQLRQVARYDLADKLVNVYANISGPRRVLRLQGEINLEWGRALQETEKQNPDNLKNARARYQAAGEACSKLVELPGLPVAEQGEFIWTAAQAFILAQATDQAIQRLEQAVKHNLEPQRLGEAWFRLAELYRSKGKKPEALAAFAKCMEHDT